jgi:hypothetical protein
MEHPYGFYVICGGPMTGKTTLVRRLTFLPSLSLRLGEFGDVELQVHGQLRNVTRFGESVTEVLSTPFSTIVLEDVNTILKTDNTFIRMMMRARHYNATIYLTFTHLNDIPHKLVVNANRVYFTSRNQYNTAMERFPERSDEMEYIDVRDGFP